MTSTFGTAPGQSAVSEFALPLADRVGLFGGAFDPPHLGHRQMAEVALEQLGLDVLHILPTGQAWHKARQLTVAQHRLAMCDLAFGDLLKSRVDAREIERQGPTYTADTLSELSDEYPGAELYLVIGADQLLSFKTWVRWQEILDMATLAVAGRVPQGAGEQGDCGADLNAVGVPFVALNMPLFNVSATAIRARAASIDASGANLDRLVSDDVASYISLHHLYQDPT